MTNPYVELCLNLQAVRRKYEEIRSPVVPATGVAASLYTHQLANVLRVLTDIRVRHLLADEVGLGKTVQALMILNALRIQRSDLRALIIVPDTLMEQWRDEIITRAHTTPFEAGNNKGADQYIQLAWEAQLRKSDSDEKKAPFSLSDIDPTSFDILIVDELHRLRADVQDRIIQVGHRFEHILVLTATPAFQDAKRHSQLFALLEPERTALARWELSSQGEGECEVDVEVEVDESTEHLDVKADLSRWPAWALAAIADKFIKKDSTVASSVYDPGLTAAALTHCAYRRVIRTRRVDYIGVLPHRQHKPLVVEPLSSETDRQSMMWQYFSHLDELSQSLEKIPLAKRAILSPPSMQKRIDELRRDGHERAGLLEKMKPLFHRSNGDSRADALIDLLMRLWATDPEERILVAAQDNPTVDYLFDFVQARLPIIGPIDQRRPLKAARVRYSRKETNKGLSGLDKDNNMHIKDFQDGDAQILFAPEAAQVGLNFQSARVFVLYSIPWRLREIEQWIGRLDRLGNPATFNEGGEAKAIEIYTISQRGLVDERIVSVLQRFHVFERSVNLDGDHLEEVSSLIEDAALNSSDITWRELEDATEEMAAEDEIKELDSPLRAHLPWSVNWAKRERERIKSLPPATPVLFPLHSDSDLGPPAWDRALEGFLELLKRDGHYRIHWNGRPHAGKNFRILWYHFDDPHPYITRRDQIGTWPRLSVTLELSGSESKERLRFLNFGDALHDQLIKAWSPNDSDLVMLEVLLFDHHAFWNHACPGYYFFRLLVIDPAAAFENSLREQLMEKVVLAAEHSDFGRLAVLTRPFRRAAKCALESDIRWLRSQLTASMTLDLRRLEDGNWIKTTTDAAAALMNPIAHKGRGLPISSHFKTNEQYIAAIKSNLSDLRQSAVMTARSEWSHRFPALEDSLTCRLMVVEEEGRDATELASMELLWAKKRLKVIQGRGDRAQISRAENVRDAAADTLAMTRVFWSERTNWLQQCQERILKVQPQEQMAAFISAQKVC